MRGTSVQIPPLPLVTIYQQQKNVVVLPLTYKERKRDKMHLMSSRKKECNIVEMQKT